MTSQGSLAALALRAAIASVALGRSLRLLLGIPGARVHGVTRRGTIGVPLHVVATGARPADGEGDTARTRTRA